MRASARAPTPATSRVRSPRAVAAFPPVDALLVGVGGLSLVGGFGFLGRAVGLVSDRIVRMQAVTAEGEIIETSRDQHQDLFWALRGAGAGGFAIISEIEMRTHKLAPLTGFYGRWPTEEAAALDRRLAALGAVCA